MRWAEDSKNRKVGRGLAVGDFDRDGDLDLLLTTNNGAAYSVSQRCGERAIGAFASSWWEHNRIGMRLERWCEIECNGQQQTRMVRSGSSYLSQSELPVTFGVGKEAEIERVVIDWPSGKTEEHKKLRSGRMFQITENKDIAET